MIRQQQSPDTFLSYDLSQQFCHRGENILDLTYQLPLLFVFLRQMGCIFCRQALTDLSEQRFEIEMEGAAIALVHMSDPSKADPILAQYNLDNVVRISNPDQSLYKSFRLKRGSLHQIFGPIVWYKFLIAYIKHKQQSGRIMGDIYQMPGIFLIYQGTIFKSYKQKQPYERPTYKELARFPSDMEKKLAADLIPLY